MSSELGWMVVSAGWTANGKKYAAPHWQAAADVI